MTTPDLAGSAGAPEAGEQQLQRLEVILEAALAHLTVDDLLEEILTRVRDLLAVDTVAVLLLDAGSDELVARASKGIEEEVERGVRVAVGTGFAGRVAADKRPVIIDDVEHADLSNPLLREKGLRALLGVPLLVEGRVIGVLHVGSLGDRGFSEEDARLLETAATRMATAIEHARLFEAERAARAEAEAALNRLTRLEALTEAALAHLSADDLLQELLVRLVALLDVDTVAIHVLDEEANELVATAAKGLEQEVEEGLRLPLGRGFAGRIAAERRCWAVPDIDQIEIVNPLLREKGIRSLLGAPLLLGGNVVGVLHVGSLTPRNFSEDEAQLLQAAADRLAAAMEHARLYESERTARRAAEQNADQIRRLEAITEVALTHLSFDDDLLDELLTRVRDILAADTAAILLLDAAADELVARAAKGLEEEVESGVRIPVGGGFAGRIARDREPVVLDDIEQHEILNPILREKGVRSLMGAPLLVGDRVLGVLHVGTLEPRHFTEENVTLLRLAAERIAIALDHAQLYEREHRVAETLQRSLLPDTLPDLHGLDLAARYEPGSEESEVGGDWYDVVTMADGRLGLIMGDVVSRGLRAATVMGQLRNALRAYALDGVPPAEGLARLNRVVRALDERDMATVVFMILDTETHQVTFANAGHPPPLIVGSQGSAEFVEEARSVPLGALSDPDYPSSTFQLEPGSTMVLYTDGLVEKRDVWIAEGLDALQREALRAPAEPSALADHLLATLTGEGTADDVALLAVHAHPADHDRLELELPAIPTSLLPMRRAMRRWLAGRGATENDMHDVLVAVTEAAANAVEHAYGPSDASFWVELEHEDDGVTVVVRDDGLWRPPRGRNRGRGTLLMQTFMEHFEVATSEDGTVVRMVRKLGSA